MEPIKTKEIRVIENCPKFSFKQNTEYNKCKECTFHVNDSCVYKDCTLNHSMHVTEFETHDGKYHIKKWGDLTDEQKDQLLKQSNDDIDTALCIACCFHHNIPGKGNICQLRYSANSETALDMLCCFDDEFWEKTETYEE
jgi:hypothetical protein